MGWIAQDGFSGGFDSLWRRGKFVEVREIVQANLKSGNTTPAFVWNAARAMEETHDFLVAADLYQVAALASGVDLELVRKATEREYHCRWLANKANPDASWIIEQTEAVNEQLKKTEDTIGPRRKLALELDYLLKLTVDPSAELSTELAANYPDSELVLQAATKLADSISVERQPEERLAMIESFLAKFPKNYWRHVVYRYWLHYAWQSHSGGELQEISATYLTEYPDHPESLGVVSRYFFEADIEPMRGEAYARRSLELYETLIGLDGSPASLKRIQQATQHTPPQPDHHLPTLRDRFHNYLGSRFNLARYLNTAGESQAALDLILPILKLDPYTVDEDQTLAPFYLIAGQAALELGDLAEAYRYFLGSVVQGDLRNRYALQAQLQLDKLADILFPTEISAIRQEFTPDGLKGITLPVFTDVTNEVGLQGLEHRRIAWGDIDGDGDPDLLLDGQVLMGNDKGIRFGSATRGWKIIGPAIGGLFADYDNDGDLDIYCTAGVGDKDRLWRNEGTFFVDLTALSGNPSDKLASEGAAWLDYDNDGWLDLYIANYGQAAAGAGPSDRLYHNTGRLFEETNAASVGLAPPFGEHLAGQGVCIADYDNDGDPDIFVGNYRLQENLFWENGVDGFFNAGRLHNVAGSSRDGWWGHTIGSAWGDIDNDGDLDLFSANLVNPRFAYFSDKSMLLINGGDSNQPRFNDQRESWGIKFAETHTEPAFFDANNDGYLDLYITAAYPNRRSFLYLNDGRGKFHDVTYLAGARVFDGWSCAWADYDNDGDLDLAVGSPGGMRLLRNDTPQSSGNHWLTVECVGSQSKASIMSSIMLDPTLSPERKVTPLSNKSAIGARVTLRAGDLTQIREIQSGKGSTTGNQLIAHFGLGNYAGELTLEVRFPSGVVVSRTIFGVDLRVVIQETIPVALPRSETPVEVDGQEAVDTQPEDEEDIEQQVNRGIPDGR